MQWLGKGWRRLGFFFRRGRFQRDLEEEMREHLLMKASDISEAGVPPDEARNAARREFGNPLLLRERSRDAWGFMWLEGLLQDLRYGLRQLRRNQGFTAVAVLTLALGIGATTVMFSIVDNVLLHPFPYKDASRYTTMFLWSLTRPGDGRGILRIPEFIACEKQNRVFDGMFGYMPLDILYKDAPGTQRIDGAFVTANTFQFLGIKPHLGRTISPADGKTDSSPVVDVSYRLWQSLFHGDPGLLGKTIVLIGEPRTVVGIMPPQFQFAGASVWLPYRLSPNGGNVQGAIQPPFMVPVGLRKPGVTLKAAASDLLVILKQIAKINPDAFPKRFTVEAQTLTDSEVGHFKVLLYILFGAVIMLLLIACSNVANLLLARATARQEEIVVRAAIGAGRGRLIRQLLVESSLLAVAGGLLGWLLAYGSLRGVVAAIPVGTIPASAVISLNPAVLMFAIGITLVTTLLCGLAPALHAVGSDFETRLREVGRAHNGGLSRGRLRASLVIAEVAISIVLLAGAGLMLRTFLALESVDLGFNPEEILQAELVFGHSRENTLARENRLLQQIVDKVEAVPGVSAASIVAAVPPNMGPYDGMEVLGQTFPRPRYAMFNLVSAGYFKTVGLPLIRGRLLTPSEVESVRRVAVINQTLARDFFGNDDPIGQEIKFTLFDRWQDAPHNAYFRIIGIVKDIKNDGPKKPIAPEAFLPYPLTAAGERSILLRSSLGTPSSILPSLRRAVWSVAPGVALTDVGSVKTSLEDHAYAQPRFALCTLAIFGGLGLVLVIVGVFCVMSYSLSLRVHEIGIRMALGAERRDVLRMVITQGMKLALIGVVIGIAGALALTRFLASLLYGVKPTDPVTFVAVSLILIAVALLASYIPARRAANVDPMVALRDE
jgi:putative ABC transport system permease protein